MNRREEFSLPEDLSELGGRLTEARPELSPPQLDGIKARAVARAGRATRQGKGQFMRTRLATIAAAFALLLGGTGIVWAAAGGNPGGENGSGSVAHAQYCPPKSHGHGKPKHHGGGHDCGHPNPGHGHGHGHEKHGKKH